MEKQGKIEGFKEKEAPANEIPIVEWSLDKEDLEKIKAILDLEQRTINEVGQIQLQLSSSIERAKAFRKNREELCVEFETKYNVPKGTNWIVDFEKKALIKRS